MASRRVSAFALAAGSVLTVLVAAARRRRARAADAAFFADKHVVITGGTRGLGFVLTRMLLAAGARVMICGRSAASLAGALQSLEEYGDRIAGQTCDVREREACYEFVRSAQTRFGPIDVLMNNAGIIEVGAFADQTLDDFRAAMATHFWAPLHTMTAVLPAMRARQFGRIVNVASIGGVVGVPHLAPYAASKFAQIGLTQALAAENAAAGVRITSIIPGLMRTGSPDNAIFKGRHRAEYAWFTLSDANPLISVSASAAARRILRAARRGEAQAVIGVTAQAAKTLNALFPQTTTTLLQFAAALLPPPGGDGTRGYSGAASRSAWTQNILTLLNRRAMRENNEEIAADERAPSSSP